MLPQMMPLPWIIIFIYIISMFFLIGSSMSSYFYCSLSYSSFMKNTSLTYLW